MSSTSDPQPFNTTSNYAFQDVAQIFEDGEDVDIVLPGIMSASVYNGLVIFIARVTLPLTEIFGIVTNTFNLVVFWSMGLTDSVTSAFFALSMADFFYLIASLIGWTCSLLGEFHFQNWINLKNLSYISVWYSLMFLAMSVFLTTYIALQRCCCVVLPMKFKGVFTVRRNAVAIALIFATSAALHIPILSRMGLKWRFNSKTNQSVMTIWYADDWDSFLTIKDILVGLWLPVSTQLVTVICMFILISGLRESSRFRQYAASNAKSKSNKKEIQIVKAVSLVTLLFIISNMAPICQAVIRRAVKGFGLYKRYNNTFFVVVVTKHALQHLNASLNIFVYLRYNSTYRNVLKKILRRDPTSSSKGEYTN